MDGQRISDDTQPMVPVPQGEHIVVSDPFIDDFLPSARPPCAYETNPPGLLYNCQYSQPFASQQSFLYVQQSAAAAASSDVPAEALGRLFPGDQPVIVQNSISPMHPYIPPVFPCGFCRREILDNVQAVQCYLGCKFWFHRTCVGLSEEAFQLLLKDPYAEWMCDPCYETKRDSVDDGRFKIMHSYGYQPNS